MSSQVLSLLDFLQIIIFVTNVASTGGPQEISRRAACGPRAAGWTALMQTIVLWPIGLESRSRPTFLEGRGMLKEIQTFMHLRTVHPRGVYAWGGKGSNCFQSE